MARNLGCYITIVFLVGAFFAVPFENGCAEAPLVAGEILKKTGAVYQQTKAFSAGFQQSVTSAAAGRMSSEASGRLYYEKPQQMRWEYEKPEPQVFVANHQLAWLYVPSEKQISLSDSRKIFSHPLAQTFFEGVGELRKHYDVTLDHKQSTKESAVLKLISKKEDPEITTLFLTIDLQTYRISVIEAHNALGNINRISLDSQRALSGHDPLLFQLDVPPAVDVVDAEGRPLTPAEIDKLRHDPQAGSGK
ncbi:MAG TPA: outer membrane lipoprotein carrier protein LolA [Syntrophobacteraceae bacterium]|nr:outer membrane lipoprotein carrier protein LolA [Syntrophobacteraceae bacterium]